MNSLANGVNFGTMTVIQEILAWSETRPLWQRDALRRLLTTGNLRSADYEELSAICKSAHGLGSSSAAVPLDSTHLPSRDDHVRSVSLRSLTHRGGVNALAANQTIDFGPQLTVVFGHNAAGKSGYTRILKRACRARGAEEILGNVLVDAPPRPPAATIRYSVDGRDHDHSWDDEGAVDSALATISVFDRHCASVYIAQRTDVAFRPLGLDLFDKLSDACQVIRRILERERQQLESNPIHLPPVPSGTVVHDALANLTPMDSAKITDLATLTDEERHRITELKTQLKDLQSHDPVRTARSLQLRADRVRTLLAQLLAMGEACSDASIRGLFAIRTERDGLVGLIKAERATAFGDQPLDNTGSDAWHDLWYAAQQYSEIDAYPQRPFPHVTDDAYCVLCQQALDSAAADRLLQFSRFLHSNLQRRYDQAEQAYSESLDKLREATSSPVEADPGLDDLDVRRPDLAAAVRSYLSEVARRMDLVGSAIDDDAPVIPTVPALPNLCQPVEDYLQHLESRADLLRYTDHGELLVQIREELRELEARRLLAEHLDSVLAEIDRRTRHAVYRTCMDDTGTTAVTRKSVEVTKRVVTEQLIEGFAREVAALGFRHVEVGLVAAGGSRGVLYHKLQLRRAPHADVASIVSEGESRCLSLASFLTELTTGDHRSAILFDDPVSSLDHEWRRNVAKRLVYEAQSRQVVVFSHDIVFLFELQNQAEKADVDLKHQYVHRDQEGAGRSRDRLPWDAMPVRKRIGYLKSRYQDLEKVFRQGDVEEYERDAKDIYGMLREAWERGVEEVLLDGAVERFRNSIQTRRIRKLIDISSKDIATLEAGMSKTSTWLRGHDQAAAVNAPVPEPNEVMQDIKELEAWVKAIRKRRG